MNNSGILIGTLVQNGIFERCFSKWITKTDDPDAIIYPMQSNKFATNIDSLKNKIFKVISIRDIRNNKIEAEDCDSAFIELQDTLTKFYFIFKYDVRNKKKFPFLTTLPKNTRNEICDAIDRKIDDFTDQIILNSPVGWDACIHKTIKNNVSNYGISLSVSDSYCSVNQSKIILLFTDGSKWNRVNDISVTAGSDYYNYFTYITLTQSELKLFSTKIIDKFRLGIFDKQMNICDAMRFREFVRCIINAK